ncbi:MAG: hypothetical protein D3918_03815 [Candidatus Electrothrix sp. AX2]|nr:hypothetical protein [Candidatus Electrothrix gigas]
MQRSCSLFKSSVSLFVIVCFVNALVYSSVYAAAADLPYNADLMLDDEYHDISYKVFEHREGDDTVPIDESPQYRANALSLKEEMREVIKDLYTDEDNDLNDLAIGAVFFVYGYPDNLEVIFVSDDKVERNYKRTIDLKDKLLKENLRIAAITINFVENNGEIKENFSVIMEIFSVSDINNINIIPEYTLTKINPWEFVIRTKYKSVVEVKESVEYYFSGGYHNRIVVKVKKVKKGKKSYYKIKRTIYRWICE